MDVTRRLAVMTPVRLDWSTSVRSRFAWPFLLCAIALGIVGMCGPAQCCDTAQAAGHHVTQAVDMVPTAATPDSPSIPSDSSPGESPGLLTLCLMMLAPAIAVGVWLLARSRVIGWRPRRVLLGAVVVKDVAVLPPPLWQRATVLRI